MSSQYAKLQVAQEDIKGFQGAEQHEHQRRFYEVCMVFRCKTSKFVQDPDMDKDVTGLQEADPEDKKKMELWKQRREAILRSLQNCGLHIFCYYSRDRDEVLVKVGAPPQKLRDTAARMKYKLQLKKQYLNAYAEYRPDFPGRPERGLKDRRVISHIYKTHTEDDYPDSDAIFKTLDRINLINRIITSKDKDCAGINVGKLMYDGELRAFFPLHEAAIVRDLKKNKFEWFWMTEDFSNKLRDYFGDRIAFYFLFMAFYWKWLCLVALVGLSLQFIDLLVHTPDNITAIPFCILMSVWSTFLPYFWRRQEAKYAIGWGTLDLVQSLEPCRPEHHGDQRINPVTSQVEPFYPKEKRRWDYAFSVGVMTLVGSLTSCLLMIILYCRHNYRDHTPGGLWAFQIGLAWFVEFMNGRLTSISQWLTTRENHRTQSEHETAMLAKVMIFKFLNSYLILFYTAFFKHHERLFGSQMKCWQDDCFEDLSWQLAIFVFFRLTMSNLYEYVEPRVNLWWRSLFMEKRAFLQTLQTALNGSIIYEMADMSAAEQQSKREKYDEFRNFDEILLSHGFATFFAVTSPWVCFATLCASLIEIGMDMRALMDSQQRPMPYKARSNEPWSTAFDMYGVLAASTNILLLIFASDQYDNWTYTEKLVLFIYLEHMLLIARLVLKVVFPQVPRNVELLQLKQEHMVHRCLENIKVEQGHDFSMFRDHRVDQIEVFESDIMERDDDDIEPVLDLGASSKAFMHGFTEEKASWMSWKPM